MTVTEFRTSRARTFGFVFTTFLIAWPVGMSVTWLLRGSAPDPWWGSLLQGVIVGAAVGALLTFFTPGWKPTWIRTSSDGLEWSAAGADPRHLRWADIAGVQVRRRFLRWVLEVTPAGTEQVFAVDLTRVSPGPCVLRAEISRWSPASSRQNT